MHFPTPEACRTYVEAELDRVVRSRGWHATTTPPSPDYPAKDLSWTISPTPIPKIKWHASWYGLEARLATQEFILWFGNHQVGAEGLDWVLHPALHVLFTDLWPREDILDIHCSLGDVLEVVIRSLELPQQMAIRFEMNTVSVT